MVSVIIPTYNRAQLINRAIQSVLNQTYKDIELIIIDDGSTDNTKKIIESINDKRLKYIYQDNAGACAARNNGIEHAKGDFIAFHDSDDIWHEDKLEKQINVLQNTEADIVFCTMTRIKDDEKVGLIGDSFTEGLCTSTDLLFEVGTQTLCASSVVFKDEQFDVCMPRLQEFELLLRIQRKYKVHCIKEPLVDYYMQNDSISMNPGKLIKAWNIILDKHEDFLDLYKRYLEKPALSILTAAWQTNDKNLQKDLISLAYKLKKSPKILLKAFLIKRKRIYKCISIFHKILLNFWEKICVS